MTDKCTNPVGKEHCPCRGEGCEYWLERVRVLLKSTSETWDAAYSSAEHALAVRFDCCTVRREAA